MSSHFLFLLFSKNAMVRLFPSLIIASPFNSRIVTLNSIAFSASFPIMASMHINRPLSVMCGLARRVGTISETRNFLAPDVAEGASVQIWPNSVFSLPSCCNERTIPFSSLHRPLPRRSARSDTGVDDRYSICLCFSSEPHSQMFLNTSFFNLHPLRC